MPITAGTNFKKIITSIDAWFRNSEVMSRHNHAAWLKIVHYFLADVHGAGAFEERNRVNRLASFWARRICGVDAVLRRARFLKVALAVEVSH
jgi:hypothetical protein